MRWRLSSWFQLREQSSLTGVPMSSRWNIRKPEIRIAGCAMHAVRPGFPNQMLEIPNRGKRSVGIDVATTKGRETLFRLLRNADVFLTNFMPATLRKLELEWEDIHALNPRIVYARGSGYGPLGPDADAPAFDLAATWARAGLLDRITRDDSDEPALFPGSVGDLSAGVNLAAGIAAALFRQRTGEGTQVDVSLLHTGTWILGQSISAAAVGLDGAAIGAIAATRKHPPNPLVNSYLSSDRRWLTFASLQADKHWPDFCLHIDRPDLVDDERFVDTSARAKTARSSSPFWTRLSPRGRLRTGAHDSQHSLACGPRP